MKTEAPAKPDLRIVAMVGILLAMWAFFAVKVGPAYLSGDSTSNLSRDMATWTILAAGMTLVIISRNIDLSVGSLLALSAATAAYLVNGQYGPGLSATLAVPAALAVGSALGLWQGLLVAHVRIPSFIVTLAGLFIFRGITQKISARDPRVPDGSWVNVLGFGHVPPAAGWIAGAAVAAALAAWAARAMLRRRRMHLPTAPLRAAVRIALPGALILAFVAQVNRARPAGIPAQTVVMAAVLAALHFVSRHTRFGRHVHAVGGNPEAARLSGINVEAVTIAVFGIAGFLAALAGIVWMAQNQGSTKNAGQWYELYAIAACVIGGTSLLGGRGTILGTFLGALVMATVIQGMDYTDLENWVQLVVRGGAVALAVGIDVATKDPAPWMVRLRDALRRRLQSVRRGP